MKARTLILPTLALAACIFATLAGWPTSAIGQAEDGHDHFQHQEEKHLDDLFAEDGDKNHAFHEDLEAEDNGDHEGHEGHEEDEEGGAEAVKISSATLKEFDIELQSAGAGALHQYIELPGEIVLNADRLAHVVPRVPGIVQQVDVNVSDQVKKGELLAILESSELADAKAEYLAAVERLKLARANFEREEKLFQKKVSAEQDFLDARQALAEARIVLRSTEQKLHALGFSNAYLEKLPNQADTSFTRYRITAPIDGTVIEKHITLGENIKEDDNVFTIADLSSVWVDIDIYQKDLGKIRKDQRVVIKPGHGLPEAIGEIAWVSPLVGEETRTALARVILPNPEGVLRPGLFITARIATQQMKAEVVIPVSALQSIDGKPTVFVKTEDGFAARPVRLGARSGESVEVLSGLHPGERFAATNTFVLKSELNRSALEHAGHAH